VGESGDMQSVEVRALGYLRSGLPAEAGPFTDDELLERFRPCAGRCAAYGLSSEEQILDFTAACCLLGERFDSDPENAWVAEVLNDPEAPPDERAALLLALAATIVEEKTIEDTTVEEIDLEDASLEEIILEETSVTEPGGGA